MHYIEYPESYRSNMMTIKYQKFVGFQIYADIKIVSIDPLPNDQWKVFLSNGRSETISDAEFMNYINGTIPMI